MRGLAAILILSACSCFYAQTRDLKTTSIKNILDCTFTIGPIKCLSALTAWRAKRAIDHPKLETNLTQDLQQFPWKEYRNESDDELYSEVCDRTEQLLRRKPLTLTVISGYRLELVSKGNGTLNVDVFNNMESESGRSSMKKAKKKLYQILPLLVLPGLIMSAILPFVLPALKMMVLGAGMLNNMALTGAVFTLLRNNAFNDRYEHKVIYVNEGYKNEKYAHYDNHDHNTEDIQDFTFAESNPPSAVEIPEIETIQELPLNSDWIKEYYGQGQNVKLVEKSHRRQIKRGDSSNSNLSR